VSERRNLWRPERLTRALRLARVGHSGRTVRPPPALTVDDLVEASEVGDWKMPAFKAACTYAASQGWLIVEDDTLTLTTAELVADPTNLAVNNYSQQLVTYCCRRLLAWTFPIGSVTLYILQARLLLTSSSCGKCCGSRFCDKIAAFPEIRLLAGSRTHPPALALPAPNSPTASSCALSNYCPYREWPAQTRSEEIEDNPACSLYR
jgi:hypothetical protein